MHLDAWGILNWVDGYKIEITEDLVKQQNSGRLYFINLGGYDSEQFAEQHKNIFVIAKNEQEAQSKALNIARKI